MLGLKGKNSVVDDFYFPIRGDSEHEYYYDIWSNIHYGYVGASLGFPRDVLQFGAAIGEAFITGVNDQSDVVAVDIGIDLWNQYGTDLTANQLQQAILAKRDQLKRTNKIINGV